MSVELIAEIGASHGGDVERALRLAEACANAGASVIKAQVGLRNLAADTSPLHATLVANDLSLETWERVAKECRNLGVEFSASIWDEDSAAWLASIKAPWIKIGSGDATWEPTLNAASMTGLPVYLSTGACTETEVRHAIGILGKNLGCLLACTMCYPARPEDAHLSRLTKLRALVDRVPVGYSCHVRDWSVCLRAAQRGASVIEVHVALEEAEAEAQGGFIPVELEQLAAHLLHGSDVPEANRRIFDGPGVELGVLPCEEPWVKLARRDPATGRRA